MSYVRCLSALLMFIAAASGCSSSELTRARAARVIDDRFGTPDTSKEFVVRLQGGAVNEGLFAGVWDQDPRPRETANTFLLTAAGRQFFQQIRLSFGNTLEVYVLPVFRRKVAEVTGIADALVPFAPTPAAGLKEVQFTWHLDNVPPWLVVQGPTPREGRAFLRLFDDGWRVEDLNFTDPEVSIDWSKLNLLAAESRRR